MPRIIITGGPGTGKSSLLAALEQKGYPCFPEVSRIIIAEQQATGGNLFPWGNISAFSKECYVRMQAQLADSFTDISFFDRGIPDIIAYLRRYGSAIPAVYFQAKEHYSSTVLVCPPWPEIFCNDHQRPESFDETCLLNHHLCETYTAMGFSILEIPKVGIAERVDWVLKTIRNTL
ncbi:AAA family ATPase [Williamwhitmania taraxaci]|uniref:Predicted ATPase n=1 Tax=Williamwhitmania taraxaci TaxID=1640674 RepID=A0A1G6MLF3_9BACT|nr:AAA family ATPase [Williamwhitmania taraxaci]SDC56339.1 Predicted ATPase [Williamwhitmania taraxaci]